MNIVKNYQKDDEVIYVDHSILSTFSTCNEKGRLAYVEHLRPLLSPPPLVFGGAFHEAIASYYTHYTKFNNFDEAKKVAIDAFIKEASKGNLPINADSGERRSIERGMYLVQAYIDRWKQDDTKWRDVLRPDNNEPYIEIGFAVYFMEYEGRPVVFVGKVDRIRRYRVDNMLYNWETKTTTSSVKHYVTQHRPNHQVTGYKWAVEELLGIKIAGTLWDVTFVSDRKIDGKFPNGIDPDKDFARVESRRSIRDVEEFLFDLRLVTQQYLSLQSQNLSRWHRNAPSACFMYGGCHFADICASNLNPSIIKSKYKVERWQPWELQVESPKS